MALIRRNACPPLHLTQKGVERQEKWVRILTQDPTRSQDIGAEISAFGVLALASGFLLLLAILFLRPVVQRIYPNPFPNLATLAMLCLAAAVSVGLVLLLRWLLTPWLKNLASKMLNISTIFFVVVMTSLFLILVMIEFYNWLLTTAGIQILINSLLEFIRWIG
jgi:hypothetical protein